MKKFLPILFFVNYFMLVITAYGSPFTPLEWQQRIAKHGIQATVGQRKHTTWIRDHNRNFIDDEIERRHEKGELVDIIVDLNTCLSYEMIVKLLEPFGKIRYVGKLITFVMLDDVLYDDLENLASAPEVAMIEIQEVGQIMTDVSARAIQSKASVTYSPNTAVDAGFTGTGITIAVLDTGVDDGHEQFAGKFVGGFNALEFEDTNMNGIDDSCEPAPLGNGVCTDADDEPADGTSNPDDDQSHGSHVAGIALGQGVNGRTCSNPDDGSTPNNCAGTAPGAGLVDIKICDSWGSCTFADVAEALDWLGLNYQTLGVRVVNMSIGFCTDDDGTNAMSQQVNYLESLGLVMAVAHGNASNCGLAAGTIRTMYPGSASFAITVGGTNDRDTVASTDETNYSQYLQGPRNDFNAASPNLLALKPDISAPGEGIFSARYDSTNLYISKSGTSMATPHIAGAAGLILQAQPNMDPGSVKDLLKRSANINLNNAAYPAIDPNWDTSFGSGMLDAWEALNSAAATDIGFPTCIGPPSSPGRPCTLSGGLPSWNNTADIDTAAPPQVGVPNLITADVRNSGSVDATVLLSFGVYVFAAGNNQFYHIGTQQVTIPGGSTTTVSQPWTPVSSDHQCIQVSIDYGLDTDFDNNVTQRNLSVAPSIFKMIVENPFGVPTEFEIKHSSKRKDWVCKIDESKFALHPYRDCPKTIKITYDAPREAEIGDRADCDIAVFARPEGEKKDFLIGGVTVQSFVPKPCRIIGWIRDEWKNPIQSATVILETERKPVKTQSDEYGFISFEATPYRPQLVTVITKTYGKQNAEARFFCGAGTFEMIVSKKGLTIESEQRGKDWAWDLQLLEGYKPRRGKK